MLVTPSVAPNKKRKRTSGPAGSSIEKKSKKKSNPVPELILCADQLKDEVKDDIPIVEAVLNSHFIVEQVDHIPSPETVKIKKKKKKKKKEIESTDVNVQNYTKSTKESENVEIKLERTEAEDTEYVENKMEGLVKPEPVSPKKPIVKIEPSETTTLFNSNIKKVNQELSTILFLIQFINLNLIFQELEEAIYAFDIHVHKKLCYNLEDTCIEQYQSTIHCAIPPLYSTNIK